MPITIETDIPYLMYRAILECDICCKTYKIPWCKTKKDALSIASFKGWYEIECLKILCPDCNKIRLGRLQENMDEQTDDLWINVNEVYELPEIGDKVEMIVYSGDHIKIKVDKITIDDKGTFFHSKGCAFKVLSWRECKQKYTRLPFGAQSRYDDIVQCECSNGNIGFTPFQNDIILSYWNGDDITFFNLGQFDKTKTMELLKWLNDIWLSTVDRRGNN